MKPIDAYQEYRKKVSDLREQFHRFALDQRPDIDVYYAIDNDVITLITAPWRTSLTSYLSPFIENDNEAIEALAYLLGEFLVRAPRPFLLVPPGQNELEGLWNHVFHKANQARQDTGEQLLKVLKGQSDIEHLEPRELFDFARRVLEAVYLREGPIAELNRIVRLVESCNLQRVETLLDEKNQPPLPLPGPDGEEEIRRYASRWEILLKRHAPEAIQRSRTITQNAFSRDGNTGVKKIDASVLARIEWTNLRLRETRAPMRLCFLTGDSSIERAAREHPFGEDNFARLFIRTPMAFLACPKFFKQAGVPEFDVGKALTEKEERRLKPSELATQGTFAHWIDVLFPDEGISPEAAHKYWSSQRGDELLKEIEGVGKNWATYLKSATSAYRVSLPYITEQTSTLALELRHLDKPEVRRKLDELHGCLERQSDEAIGRFGAASALAGFWSLNGEAHLPQRGIPSVKFDSFKIAETTAKQIRETGSIKHLQDRMNREWLQRLWSEEPTRYTSFVVFSLAFALAGKWDEAFTLSRAAFRIAQNGKFPLMEPGRDRCSKNIKGDEAAYLCAVFSRLKATRAEDVRESELWLRIAEILQKETPLRMSLSNVDIASYSDPRFVAERHAQDLSKLFFKIFLHEFPENGVLVGRQNRRIHDLSKELLKLYRSVSSDSNEREHVCDYVIEQTLVNYLQLQLAIYDFKDRDGIINRDAEYLVEKLAVHVLGADRNCPLKELHKSRLVVFVLLCASSIFAPQAVGWDNEERAKELRNFLQSQSQRPGVVPYDNAKYGYFLKVALEADTRRHIGSGTKV